MGGGPVEEARRRVAELRGLIDQVQPAIGRSERYADYLLRLRLRHFQRELEYWELMLR